MKSVRVNPGFPGWIDELGLSNCTAWVIAWHESLGQVPNNRASHLQIWLYCVHSIRRWATVVLATGQMNVWICERFGEGFRWKSVWNTIGKVEPWPGCVCVCVTGGQGSLEDLVSDEYFTASRESRIHFHSLAIDTPQISQIRASSKQITLHSQVAFSEALDLFESTPGKWSSVSLD